MGYCGVIGGYLFLSCGIRRRPPPPSPVAALAWAPSSDTATRSSARAAADRGSYNTTGTPALTDRGTAMSDGIGKSARMPSTCSISRTSSFTRVFARFRTSFSFGPATVTQVEGLHADLEVLHARDVHAADEQHVVRRLDEREREVVEGRRKVDDDVAALRLQRRAHRDELVGCDARRERRLGRCGQHEQAAVVAGQDRPHHLGVAEVHRGGRVDDGLLRRDPEEDGDVAELHVGVDERDRLVEMLGHAHRDVDRDGALAHPALGREHDHEPARVDPAAGRDGQAGRRVREDLTDAGDGLRERVALLLELDRVPGAGAQRLLEQVGVQLGHDEHRAELGVRRRQAVDLLEAERSDEPGAEHGHERTAGAQVLHHVLDRVELLRARQLQTQPHPEAGVGFDHRRVVAGLLRNCVRAPVFHRQLHRYVRVSARARELRFPTPSSKGVPGRGTGSPALFSCTTRSASVGDTSKVMRPLVAAAADGWPFPPAALRRGLRTDREHLDAGEDVARRGVLADRDQVDLVTRRDLVGDAALGVDRDRHRDLALLADRGGERTATALRGGDEARRGDVLPHRDGR